MGFPGDTPEEKMKDCIYTLEDGLRKENDPEGTYPQVIQECFQVFECTWVDTLDNAQDDKAGERLSGAVPRFQRHYVAVWRTFYPEGGENFDEGKAV